MKYFTIVGSKTLRRNSTYRVAVNSQGYQEPQKLSLVIEGESKNGIGEERIISLEGEKSQIVDFDLKNQPIGNYFLVAKNIDGEKFEKRTNLHLNTKKCSVFVQTDKSIYKPSDKVQFRVLVLDVDTKPYESSKVEVYITDGAQNRVKQFETVFIKGVFQDDLQLSDSPVMGDWTIHVKVLDASYEMTKQFQVAEYVLPKFQVIVESNPHVAVSDGKIHATVSGKYTFGKLAKGKATITAKVAQNWYCYGGQQAGNVSKVVDVDGKKDVEFDIESELKLREIYNDIEVEIEATFIEELSQREHKGSTTVTIHKTPYKIEILRTNDKIKPGLPFKVTALVKFHNGSPVTDTINPAEFLITYYHRIGEKRKVVEEGSDDYIQYGRQPERSEHKLEKLFLQNGVAELDFEVPASTIRISVEVNYWADKEMLHSIEKAESESDQFIQSKIVTEKPTIEVEVLATEEMSSLTYQIIGRSDVIASETLPVPNSKNFSFSFTPKIAMMPKSKLVIYYIRPDGEIISDHLEIKFGFELQNFVKVDLASEQTKPSETVDISVTANPNSFVGLLGVDQSVLLLKSGNDIDKSTVSEDIAKYNDIDHYNSTHNEEMRRMLYSDFDASDAYVLTNAKREYQIPSRFEHRTMYCMSAAPMAMRMGGGAPMNLRKSVPAFGFAETLETSCLDDAMIEDNEFIDAGNIEVRSEFPETWLFDSLDLVDGKSVLTRKVPDTITSWIITGFAVDPVTGLGLTSQPTKLNVFKPFFVSTNLPYSIKRGETVSIPIIVFNYMENDQDVEVTLFNNDDEFEFAENGKMTNENQMMKKVIVVKPNLGSTISFMIKPLKVGNIKIKVVATSAVAGDGLEQLLIVEPEGITQYLNKALFIDLRTVKEFATEYSIVIPENAVPDSTKIEVSAIGDILGPSIENLDKLIRIPYGCGEQNMLNFVPNIIILEYLAVLNKLTPEIALKAKKYMETGYQRELTYKHNDGSYSAFGKSDRSGSTWLTAFVAKSFHHAAKHIQVDNEIVKQALTFLSKVQEENGSFPEVGTVFHTDMQGGSSKGLGLTAYVLITFLENESQHENHKSTIARAIDYIVKNSSKLDDTYSLAIVAYALQLAKHSLKDSLFQNLTNKADKQNGMMHWAKPISEDEKTNPWNLHPNAVNIEMTAYALHAFLEAGSDTDSVPIMKWLVTQRNENGGFQSTQDTVVGLQALSKLATKIYVPDSQIDISLKHVAGAETKLNVNPENALILQKYELPSEARDFQVKATGHGFSVLQLSYKFNINENGEWPRFILEPIIKESSNENSLYLTVTTNYVVDGISQKSNMAVMEVSFPSGFIFDSEHLQALKSTKKVKRVETKDGETVVIVYFDEIDANKLSLDFKAIRTHNVAQLKPAPIQIYDYYDNSRQASTFYNVTF